MPFGPYKDHKDCVNKNKDKKNPDAYCATIERKIKERSKNNSDLEKLSGGEILLKYHQSL